jgi:hypothetical protein
VPVPVPDDIGIHCRLLELRETGGDLAIQDLLESWDPGDGAYIPGMQFKALWFEKQGRRAEAVRCMRRSYRLCSGRPSCQMLEGPENLPVHYYMTIATRYLMRNAGGNFGN